MRPVRDYCLHSFPHLPLNVEWVTDLGLRNQNTSSTWQQRLSKRQSFDPKWLIILSRSWNPCRVFGKKAIFHLYPGLISWNVIGLRLPEDHFPWYLETWKCQAEEWKWEERENGLRWSSNSIPWAAGSASSCFGSLHHPNVLLSCLGQNIKSCFCWFEWEFCDTTKHFPTNIVTLDVSWRRLRLGYKSCTFSETIVSCSSSFLYLESRWASRWHGAHGRALQT